MQVLSQSTVLFGPKWLSQASAEDIPVAVKASSPLLRFFARYLVVRFYSHFVEWIIVCEPLIKAIVPCHLS